MESPTKSREQVFLATLMDYYDKHGRHNLPWRQPEIDGSFNAYKILVSEIMLQQTSVARVLPKYQEFLKAFPSIQSLAQAPLADILRIWSGLGYNRRAVYLQKASRQVVTALKGTIPADYQALVSLPGIGVNTAGAILAYAFNQPAVFVETNIRTSLIYHFGEGRTDIPDSEIRKLVEELLHNQSPRIFYWALMDYGSFLKRSVGNLNRASRSYVRQSTFNGSRRQVRGKVVQALLNGPQTLEELEAVISDSRVNTVVSELSKEGFLTLNKNQYHLLAD